MKQTNLIELLRSRSEKICTKGNLLEQYKFYGDQRKRYYTEPQVYERNPFNQVQNFLYKRALYGLSIYNKTEIKELKSQEKRKILHLQERTQKELNIWKQQLVIKSSNKLLGVFHKSPLAQEIIKDRFMDPELPNKFSFGDLGIRKEDVVERLHRVGVLPENFYEINAR